ncbi:hypothetical protein [Krasilnikovia sp. MM14-A1259]|uniref:hypothetical protein n=1 Tax=Krasilnikovia sp. MM14-A1259 TaxID=3373539 RepID=UPI00382BE00E
MSDGNRSGGFHIAGSPGANINMESIGVVAPLAAAAAAVAKEAYRQRGETRREELRQQGKTARTALTGRLPDEDMAEASEVELPD